MNKHLNQSQTTYWAHFAWAIVAGLRLIWAGIASLIHAIHPSLFPGTAAHTVIDMYYQQLHNHPNPEYQIQIKEKKK
jgi:hypothetical protein